MTGKTETSDGTRKPVTTKVVLWVLVAVVVLVAGFLLFKPASGSRTAVPQTSASQTIPTSGKPVFIEFYTDS
jgi:cell division protein FtsN